MRPDQLNFLFEKYLKRPFRRHELNLHGKKDFKAFEQEIAVCGERKLVVGDIGKMAIIISGHIRNNSILKNLVNFLSVHDCDVFVHTWDNLGFKGNETNLNDKKNLELVEKEISRIPGVKKFKIENNKKFIESLPEIKGYFNHSSPEKFIKSQLYSINQAYKLMEEYSEEKKIDYRLLLRFRFDSEITNFCLEPQLIKELNENDIIFVPNRDSEHEHPDYGSSCWMCDNMYYKHKLRNVHIFDHTNIICDLFAYGSVKSMKTYCSLYEVYDELNKSFYKKNIKSSKKNNKHLYTENGDYKFDGELGHIDTLYYYYCSYPERLLQVHLKDYMLVESKQIKLKLIR
jgi:hypothetical protein